MREKFVSEKNQQRALEMKRIRDLAPTMAATQAALDMLLKVSPDIARSIKDKALQFLLTCPRRDLINEILCIQTNCDRLQKMINPHCRDTSIAFYTRKLTILSKVITSGIAEGKEAVTVADLLIGLKKIDIGNLEIVNELNNRNIPNFKL